MKNIWTFIWKCVQFMTICVKISLIYGPVIMLNVNICPCRPHISLRANVSKSCQKTPHDSWSDEPQFNETIFSGFQITPNYRKSSEKYSNCQSDIIITQVTSISAIISAQMFKNNPFYHVDQSMVLITIL